jgi:hypothetical protein
MITGEIEEAEEQKPNLFFRKKVNGKPCERKGNNMTVARGKHRSSEAPKLDIREIARMKDLDNKKQMERGKPKPQARKREKDGSSSPVGPKISVPYKKNGKSKFEHQTILPSDVERNSGDKALNNRLQEVLTRSRINNINVPVEVPVSKFAIDGNDSSTMIYDSSGIDSSIGDKRGILANMSMHSDQVLSEFNNT